MSAMQNKDTPEAVRELALVHGFDLCRMTRLHLADCHRDAYQAWIEAGMHGDMSYMAESTRLERRMQPESMLEGVRSVISVAMRYTPPGYSLAATTDVPDHGVISAYAHGEDYHDIMKKRLKALAADLDTLLGKHDQRVFVDTAPVLEHALADSSGLGWQGKHSLTINKQMGSWFLLGEIFTTAALLSDAPATNHCGSCSSCMDICPTGAIVAPYVVDANRCISYLTIEYHGFIDYALRPLMGNHIYGCDDCQMVCPWNGHEDRVPSLPLDYLKPAGENSLPELASLLRLDEEGFRQRFRKSPVRRTKRRGLLRNVCIAMGNSMHAGFIPQLVEALRDCEPLIRGHAAWALAQLADAGTCEPLITALIDADARENDPEVLREYKLAISQIRKKS